MTAGSGHGSDGSDMRGDLKIRIGVEPNVRFLSDTKIVDIDLIDSSVDNHRRRINDLHEHHSRVKLIARLDLRELRSTKHRLHDRQAIDRRFDQHAVGIRFERGEFHMRLLDFEFRIPDLALVPISTNFTSAKSCLYRASASSAASRIRSASIGAENRNRLHIQLGFFKSGFRVFDGLRCALRRNFELRLHFSDAGLDLTDRCTVVIEAVHHILTIKLGDDIALLHTGSRLDGILKDEAEFTATATSATAASTAATGIPEALERSGSGTQAVGRRADSCG